MRLQARQTIAFMSWHESLRDERARRRVANRITRIRDGLLGDTRSLGGGLSEPKIDYGPGYRLYYTIRGHMLLLLLLGGDKSSQQRDIIRARDLMESTEI